jgi:ABC-type branched-subunit amino acid transport system substrate-binding protein
MANKLSNQTISRLKILTVLTVILILWAGISFASVPDEPLVFGALTPLSGEYSFAGDAVRAGLSFAKEDIEAGVSRFFYPDVEIILADSGYDAALGREEARKLMEEKQVDALFSSFTFITAEVSSLSLANETPMFYDSCNCGFAEENPYAFQTYFDPRKECLVAAENFKELGADKAGFIGQDVPYGKFCYDRLIEVFGEENVFLYKELPRVYTDYFDVLSAMRADGVDFIASIPSVADFPRLISENADISEPLPIVCYEGVCLTETIKEEISPDALSNVLAFGLLVDESFEERILAKHSDFNRNQIVESAIAYDSLMYALRAYRSCGEVTPECIQKNARGYQGKIISDGFGEDNILIYESKR